MELLVGLGAVKGFVVPILLLVGIVLLLESLKRYRRQGEKRRHGEHGERLVHYALKKAYGSDILAGVYLPRRDGGYTEIDHLALTPSGILVVETKNHAGSIFGEAGEREWTKRLPSGKMERFQSPVYQNGLHVKAVKAVVGKDVPVIGHVVMLNRANFPKGVPEGVSQIGAFPKYLRQLREGDGEYRDAWEKLNETVRQDRQVRKEHRRQLEKAHGLREETIAQRLMLGSIGVSVVAGLYQWIAIDPPKPVQRARAQVEWSEPRSVQEEAEIVERPDEIIEVGEVSVESESVVERLEKEKAINVIVETIETTSDSVSEEEEEDLVELVFGDDFDLSSK